MALQTFRRVMRNSSLVALVTTKWLGCPVEGRNPTVREGANSLATKEVRKGSAQPKKPPLRVKELFLNRREAQPKTGARRAHIFVKVEKWPRVRPDCRRIRQAQTEIEPRATRQR